jgi:hypothetical protein
VYHADDQLRIAMAPLGGMPAGAGSKDALQGFHHLVAQTALAVFTHSTPP